MDSTLKKAAKLINDGFPIIVPTDTVYGLVCRYDSSKAVRKIFSLKKRDRNKPLILFGYSWKDLKKFVNLKKCNLKEINKYRKKWPGAITMVLPASNYVPDYINKGFKTIGIRIPNNKFLIELLKHSPDRVLASTSANISGQSDIHPQKALTKKVKLFIKGKKNEMLLKPSRIIEIKKNKVRILR